MLTWYIILHIVVSLGISISCTKSNTSGREWQKKEKAKKKRHAKAIKEYRRNNKEKYESVNKTKAKLEKDLKKCPKESGGQCNCDERVCGFIKYMRSEDVPLLKEEYDHLEELENKGKDPLKIAEEREADTYVSTLDRAEKASGEIYMPKVKEAMALCLKHCEEPEKLQIYVSAHEEKLKYIVSGPKWSDEFQFGYYRTRYPLDVNYKNVPSPPEFWEKVKEMKEENIREDWRGHDEVVKAYQDGYRLMRKKAGNPLTKEMEEEIKKRYKEEKERKYAEWKEKADAIEVKEKWNMAQKELEKKLAEKEWRDGVVAKAEEDKKEKSKVSQSKKIETSKEMPKEKVDEDVKKSNKSKGAETEKNKGSKEGEVKEGSEKDEGSKEKGSKMSKESTSKKPSAEEAK